MRIRRAVVGRSGTTFCVPTTSVRSTKSARRAFRAVGVARTCRIAGGGTADTVAVEIAKLTDQVVAGFAASPDPRLGALTVRIAGG